MLIFLVPDDASKGVVVIRHSTARPLDKQARDESPVSKVLAY